jgi:hypothetical protein
MIQVSFHPQIVFLPNLSVNLRACLCGVVNYASAQALDILDLGQKSSFLDWKRQKVPFFGNGLLWTGTSKNSSDERQKTSSSNRFETSPTSFLFGAVEGHSCSFFNSDLNHR